MDLEDILEIMYLNPPFIGIESEIHRSRDLPRVKYRREKTTLWFQGQSPAGTQGWLFGSGNPLERVT